MPTESLKFARPCTADETEPDPALALEACGLADAAEAPFKFATSPTTEDTGELLVPAVPLSDKLATAVTGTIEPAMLYTRGRVPAWADV